ncbi:NYN domain-containing protein [Candidatus Pacearchaeota archaeon]|nr:NYN domain-containing protein [Candidatus Pacearchaeota archaeon]
MVRMAIFIDGNNFYFGLKKIYGDDFKAMKFNFEKFCNFIANNREIIEVHYYNAPLDRTKDLEKYKSQQKFFEKLKKIPKFNVVLCKLLRRKIRGMNQYYYVLKEDDIHMAGDMIKGAFKNFYDVALLVSGDGDFVPAVRIVREEGKKVENIYFKKSASTNLKQNCDKSFMLKKNVLDGFFD